MARANTGFSKDEDSAQVASGRQRARILIVDDHPDLLRLISIRLRPYNFELRTAASAEDALTTLSIWPADLVITDLRLPGMSGMELFQQIQSENPLLPVIILTAHGTIQDAVAATQAGVVSYLTKPFDGDELIERITSSLMNSGFTEADTVSADKLYYDPSWRGRIISTSSAMKAVLAQVEKLASGDTFVILDGETGTGKREMAHALHRRSNRSDYMLIEINCSAYTDQIFAAEMFGIAADPSSGVKAKSGKLREANGSTLLLRDIDEASPELIRQVLTAIIEKEASPINSTERYAVNSRLVATTSSHEPSDQVDLEGLELGHQLGMSLVHIPPLRERREDIPLITHSTLQEVRENPDAQFSSAALRLLVAAEWPGNVRQLISVVKQCVRLTNTNIVAEGLVASRLNSPLFQIAPLNMAQREFEHKYLIDVLKATRGNVTKAANVAKRNRTEFHRLLKKHKIEAKAFRQK